jgi:hypothetical protein
MALDLPLFQVRTGVAVMGQDCNYQLSITKFWGKRGNIFLFLKRGKKFFLNKI